MNQTLIAFLAMTIATLFAVNQQRNALQSYESMVRSEFELMASGVAIEKMEVIAGTDYDDLIDFDGTTEESTFEAGTTNVPFELTVDVNHIDASGYPASPSSDYAEVVVNVTGSGNIAVTVSHARVFSR